MLQRRILCLLSLIYIFIVAFSLFGPWDFLGAGGKIEAADKYLCDNENCIVEGRVYHKEIKNDRPVFYIKDAAIKLDGVTLKNTSLILYPNSDKIPNSSLIIAKGTVSVFSQARNEGNFDLKNYYNSLGLVCSVEASEIEMVGVPWLFSHDILYRLRRAVTGVFEAALPGEEAGFLSAVTMGDKALLDGDLKELFQNVGVAHVLAVSGLHVSFLCMGLYGLLRKRGVSFGTSGCLASLVAIVYCLMTGASVSSLRAVGMFIIYMVAQILGEAYDMATALALLAFILLLKNPLLLTNPSFIFSFGAILSVEFVAKPLSTFYEEYCFYRQEKLVSVLGLDALHTKSRKRKAVEAIVGSFIFSFGITAGCLPLVTSMYYQVPTYSILINMLVIPLMPVLLALGLAGGFIGLICFPLAKCILFGCHIIIFLFEAIASWAVKIPFAVLITGCPGKARIILYLFLLAMIIGIREKGFDSERLSPLFSLIATMLFIFACSFILLIPNRLDFEIDVLDVDQGDGTFISGGEGDSYFIDGGSTGVSEVGKYRILPFLKYKGVRAVDYWFITHPDEDHISGLYEAIEADYKIKNCVIAKALKDNEAFDELEGLAEKYGIRILYMTAGDSWVGKNVKFQCIYPNADGDKIDDVNDGSLCLEISYSNQERSFKGFFGGDISAEVEEKLAENNLLEKVDFLKVSHHGSKYSSNSKFLESLSPKIATISCGENNSYGHPGAETLERLENARITYYRTDQCGQIKINFKDQVLNISSYR